MNKYIGIEDVMNVKVPHGWAPVIEETADMLFWVNLQNSDDIHATPCYDENGVVPFDICDEDGNYHNFYMLSLSGSIEEQIIAYENKLNEAIEFINNI